MKKILLVSLPYWSPIIPPSGIATLKSYLEKNKYKVQTIDLNAKTESLQFYYDFFDLLRKYIPEEKQGTFYNIGHEVFRSILMLHYNCNDISIYNEVGKSIIYKWYCTKVDDSAIEEIRKVICSYLLILKEYTKFLVDYYSPYFIGASVFKTNLPLTIFFFNYVKQLNKDIITGIGGGAFVDFHAYSSDNFKSLLNISEDIIDKIFIGPGEKILHDYLEEKLPENQRVYFSKNLKMDNADENYNGLFDFSDFNLRKYSHLPSISSISCPFKCSFCNEFEFWGEYRKRSPELVVNEMKFLYQKYRKRLFFMTDSLLNPTVDALSEKIIEEDLPFFYDAYFRIDKASANIESTMKWRKGGLYRVRIGIESGSQKILDLMNKRISLELIKAAIPSLAYAGIKTTTYWVIGHPGETEEDFQMTLDMIEELKNDIWQAECNIFQYFYAGGQNLDDTWAQKRIPLYTSDELKYLKFNEWELNLEPTRELIFDRMHRFINHCKKLGIPNPYSGYEQWNADYRWNKLHKNAVPPLEKASDPDTDISPCELNVMATESSFVDAKESFNL